MRPPALRLSLDELVVDSFAGAGGASLGVERAIGRAIDIAINHDATALAVHAANHPGTRHLCESVWDVDPVEACGGRPVGLAWFSPTCTHFSRAKGGPLRDAILTKTGARLLPATDDVTRIEMAREVADLRKQLEWVKEMLVGAQSYDLDPAAVVAEIVDKLDKPFRHEVVT